MKQRCRANIAATLALVSALATVACATGSRAQSHTAKLEDAEVAIAAFKAADPSLEQLFQTAYAFAIYPCVGKGGFIFAGAYGRGIVYEQGKPVGRTKLTQVTVGPQIGGQAYSELLFFKHKAALDGFKGRNSELAAQASAVIDTDGVAAKASYDSSGVAVFIHVKGGAMLEVSVGGQGFEFEAGLGD